MTDPTSDRVQRDAELAWIPIPLTRTAPTAQRELKQHRVDKLVADFDLEQLGTPTVNHRGGLYYIIDGQHRIAALKAIGYGDQSVQCWLYQGLTEEQEAEKFLQLNDILAVDAFPKFMVAVTAGRGDETAVNRIVQGCGLRIGNARQPRTVMAVATLLRVYRQGGPDCLKRTLRIAYESFGDAGLDAAVISGVGLLCQRFNGQVDDARAIAQFSGIRNGASGLMQQVAILKQQTGKATTHCVAAAGVDFYNKGQRARRLPSWWKATAE